MKSKKSYSRKISANESEKGYIFVIKNNLTFFPSNSSFELSDGQISKQVMIKSYSCICRGPALPHEHYYIPWDGLEAGDIVEIKRSDLGQDKYFLKFI